MCCVGAIGNVNETWAVWYQANKVNSIGNSALYCTKTGKGNFQLSCKRTAHNHMKYTRCVVVISGRRADTGNSNIRPVS